MRPAAGSRNGSGTPVTGRWVRTERFETNFTDLSGRGRLLGQVAGRTGAAVTGWLEDRGQGWKDQVAYVAIDPCAVYRSAVTRALPCAVIVVDHFHLVRLANQAVTRVRQRVTRQVLGRRGTTSDPAWANRRRLLRGRERLSDQAYARMWTEILAQESTGELLAAWIAKEELRYLLSLARTSPARSEVSNRLFAFYDWCARANVPEVTTLAKHHRGLVAADPRVHRHRHHQRRHRGEQPARQGHRQDRVRVPQPRQPAPQSTVALQTDNDRLAVARVTTRAPSPTRAAARPCGGPCHTARGTSARDRPWPPGTAHAAKHGPDRPGHPGPTPARRD